jgi:hypothetical protein
MPDHYVSILLTMDQAQAAALAKFANCVGMPAVRKTAEDDSEAALMAVAIDRLCKAFHDAGHHLPPPIWGQPGSETSSKLKRTTPPDQDSCQ